MRRRARKYLTVLTMAMSSAAVAQGSLAPKAQAKPLRFPQYQVVVEVEGRDSLPLNAHCNLNVTIEPQGAGKPVVSDFVFDARMPEHQHGMVTRPKVTAIGPNRFRVEGVRLHMPGKWLLEFKFKDADGENFIAAPFVINQQK